MRHWNWIIAFVRKRKTNILSNVNLL